MNIQELIYKKSLKFINLLDRLDEPEILGILALSMYKPTHESIYHLIERCRVDDRFKLYGAAVDNKVIGVVYYSVCKEHGDVVVIHNISIKEAQQRKGVGRFILNSIKEKYSLPIELETDDDAINFYRNCGFEVAPLEKNGVRRWKCKLR